MTHPRFPLGQLVATPNALLQLSHADIQSALNRHITGEWGDLDSEDWAANESALVHGSRVFSVYHGANRVKFYIITEANRSVTTVLLPEDY